MTFNKNIKSIFNILLLTKKDLSSYIEDFKQLDSKIQTKIDFLEYEVEDLIELSKAKNILDLLKFQGQNNFEYLLKYEKENEKTAANKALYRIKDLIKDFETKKEKTIGPSSKKK